MANQWQGVLREWADVLDVTDASTVVTLGEGGTPLIESRVLSQMTDARVFVKFEGLNPTGSFKDRGMTVAVSRAVERGAKAIACASTGNTSASAAAYAAAAGIQAIVLVPEGKISMGKLASCRTAIDICREARALLGGNGVSLEHSPMRHAANLESVRTYEGTDEVHTLVIGQALTGISAFRG